MIDYPARDCDSIRGQWAAFEDLYAANRTRVIAVSNFNLEHLSCLNNSQVLPAVNQMRFSVGHTVGTLLDDDAKWGGVVVQAYSPLEHGKLVTDSLCSEIGAQHNKTAVQVALKWILQRGAVVATQSTKLSHLQSDLDLFDFLLSDEEMALLANHSTAQFVQVSPILF